MTEPNICRWCGKPRRSWSRWEQQGVNDVWSRLCGPCASQRLRNPWNWFLPMRKAVG